MALQQPIELRPDHPRSLRAPIQPLPPEAPGLVGKAAEGTRVPADTIVVEVPLELEAKFLGLLRYRAMAYLSHPLI